MDLLDVLEQLRRALGLAAREDDDALAVEGRAHHLAHAIGQRLGGDAGLLEGLLGLGLLDEVRGGLHLDDVGAELGADVRGVGNHVNARLALLGDGAARVGPEHGGQAVGLGLGDDVAQVLVLLIARPGAGVDGVAHGGAAQPHGVLHGGRHGGDGVGHLGQGVRVVHLEDEGNFTGELAGDGLQEAERRRVGAATRLDGELGVVVGIIPGHVGAEGARRTVLEALIHGQDDQLAGAGERAGVQQAGQVGEGARVVGWVPREDLLDAISVGHVAPRSRAGACEAQAGRKRRGLCFPVTHCAKEISRKSVARAPGGWTGGGCRCSLNEGRRPVKEAVTPPLRREMLRRRDSWQQQGSRTRPSGETHSSGTSRGDGTGALRQRGEGTGRPRGLPGDFRARPRYVRPRSRAAQRPSGAGPGDSLGGCAREGSRGGHARAASGPHPPGRAAAGSAREPGATASPGKADHLGGAGGAGASAGRPRGRVRGGAAAVAVPPAAGPLGLVPEVRDRARFRRPHPRGAQRWVGRPSNDGGHPGRRLQLRRAGRDVPRGGQRPVAAVHLRQAHGAGEGGRPGAHHRPGAPGAGPGRGGLPGGTGLLWIPAGALGAGPAR
ncbi:hypothetical protein STIAU_6444 [Stigmatella aurantiaca DW4/3-1]|uniref:Uncharacterized protein n=1 Tax=Stigmatella aurantiaca (strain DW4/3-1) TaxID=378806 RepID=Q08T14_STIAD|nr:hypothetical protein STIAU_6444 [Stigmatella aurantiaca DW4/3-1]